MKGALAGRTIVITRPRDQAAALAGLLEARGAQPVIAPALEIAPVRTGVVRRAMEELEADEFDWITLTSRATVEMLAEYLRPGAVRAKVAVVGFARLAGAMKGSPKVVCIGPVTAREARTHGFRVDAVASPHTIGGVVAALERVFAPPASGHRRPVKETA